MPPLRRNRIKETAGEIISGFSLSTPLPFPVRLNYSSCHKQPVPKMGRRSLPKIDQSVDLSLHHFVLEEMTPPFKQANFFAKPQKLQIEIGSGKGLFLRNGARQFPENNFVGIEIARKYARYAAYRLARDRADNAVMIDGDGLRFMREFIADDSVDAIHVYFPDPWWKERHRKRRVMKEPLLRDIQRTLVPGGELHFWTDVLEYFESSLELIAAETKLDGPFEVEPKPPEHDLDYRTHFERRMRMNGEPIYRSLYRKQR